jgi:hypothetical protein
MLQLQYTTPAQGPPKPPLRGEALPSGLSATVSSKR